MPVILGAELSLSQLSSFWGPPQTEEFFGWTLEITKRSDAHKFTVVPKRWIVERTFGWWTYYRRLSKDYEHSPKNSETIIKLVMISIMAKRLA